MKRNSRTIMKNIDPTYRRTNVKYGQIDKLLKSLGFTCRLMQGDVPVRFYEHRQSGAEIMLPPFPMRDRVVDYHLDLVRLTLDNYGIIDRDTFAVKLQRAG